MVVLSGLSFAGTDNVHCTFGGVASAPARVIDSTMMTCVAPASSSEGSVLIGLSFDSMEVSTSWVFTYVSPPEVESIWPVSGSTVGGTRITVSGSNYSAEAYTTVSSALSPLLQVYQFNRSGCTSPIHAKGQLISTFQIMGCRALYSGHLEVVVVSNGRLSAGDSVTFGTASKTVAGVLSRSVVTISATSGSIPAYAAYYCTFGSAPDRRVEP